MKQILIGVDPHKLSATIEVVDQHERVLGSGRFGTDKAGYAAMLGYVRRGPPNRSGAPSLPPAYLGDPAPDQAKDQAQASTPNTDHSDAGLAGVTASRTRLSATSDAASSSSAATGMPCFSRMARFIGRLLRMSSRTSTVPDTRT